MASKKKRGGRDDFDFDSDLDFEIPDFDSGNPEATKRDRKPIATGLKSAATGFGKTFTSEARLRKTLTKSLPREYEEPISKAFEIKDGFRDLYNTGGAQANEIIRETKRSTARIARNLEGALPKKLADKLKAWGDSADSDTAGNQSKSEIEQGTIDNAFASIFAQTQQAAADNQKQDAARRVIQDQIDQKRHKDMTSILGSVDQSLLALTTFQSNITTNYMKKSLELQFRSYFVQNDMLQLQTKFFTQFTADLQAITKNTGLPDYVKKAPKEALLEHIREKTFDSLASTISKKRSQWLGGVFKKAGSKMTDTLGQLREGLSMVLDTVEQGSGMYGSGMGPSGGELVGDLAGGIAGNKTQDWIAKKIRAQMVKNPKAVKFGNKLSQVADGLPQFVGNQINNGKFADKIPEWLKEILQPDQESSHIKMNKEVDLERAARWSEKSARSLNIVIPDLLSKIHHELYVTRTGDTSAAPLKYDYEKGKFVTNKERQEALSKTIVPTRTVEQTKHQIGSIFKEIDPKGQLDEKTRQSIAEKIYGANKNNVYFDKDTLHSHSVIGDHPEAADLIKDYVAKDSSGANERRLSKMFGNVGANNGEVKDVIQHLIDSGRQGELADMGILDPKTGKINMEMVRRMELGGHHGNNANSPQTHAQQGLEGVGLSSNHSNIVASAFGNIFSRGNVQAFAKGGVFSNKVVDKPTAFPMPNGKTGVMGEAGPEAVIPLKRDKSGKLGVTLSIGKTEKTIDEIRDTLKRIEDKGGMGGGMIMPPEMLEAYMAGKLNDAKGYFGKGGSAIKKGVLGAGKSLWNGTKNSFNTTKKIGKTLTGLVMSGGSSAFDFLGKQKDKFDLFIGNEVEPRLSKAKLEAGRYIDEASGKVIEKYEDIKGNVKDIDTGEIVLRASELKDGILKNFETGKSVLLRLTSWGKSAIKTSIDKMKKTIAGAMGLTKSVYGMAWTGLKKAYEHLTDAPQDVYLKDNYETPVLLKRVMIQGLYFDKATLDPITKVSQIKGPVVDNEENVLITKEDLANGLYDKQGKEIKTGFDKITQMVGNSIRSSLNMYKKILGKGKDLGMKAMGWIKNLFGFDSPFTVFSAQTNNILSAIYNLLNDRMPGERSPDLDTMIGKSAHGGGTGATVKKAGAAVTAFKEGFTKRFKSGKEKAEGKLDELKERLPGDIENAKQKGKDAVAAGREKLDDWKDEHWDPAEREVREKLGRGKDNVVAGLHAVVDTLRERLPEAKKKVFGDTDGDGVREGSIDDIRKKRKAEKEEATKETAEASEKGSKKGAWSALAGFFAKKKKDEGDDKEKDHSLLGDVADDVLGGGGKEAEKDGAKVAKKASRWSKLMPKGKGIGSKLVRGGMKAIGTVGKLGLKLGGTLLGGGLLSAETLMGGLGLLGSGLGMAATAVGAILSSPVTVPLLALAAAGTAGYFAYKWLTKPDPQAIEKVRLVQYGFKAGDLDAYKKMKSMEQQVIDAVVFKGDKAEFDPKKLNIQEMMKIYGLTPTDPDHAKKFVAWFANRFRPVYLNHRALIKTSNSPKPLEDVDSNKPDFKKTYLEGCLFPGDHYSVTTNPYKDQLYLFTTQSSVEHQIQIAQDEVAKEGTKKTETKVDDKAAKAAAAAKVLTDMKNNDSALNKMKADDKKAADLKANKLAGSPGMRDSDKASQLLRLQASTMGANAAPGGPGRAPGDPITGPSGPGGAAAPAKSKPGVKPMSGASTMVKDALLKNMAKFGITTPNQQAALLGNIEHESGFMPISENLNYKASTMVKLWPNRFPSEQSAQAVASQGPQGIANNIYGGRMGNTAANDGWDYRGRGPLQITGKSNYSAVGKAIGKDLINNPDLLITDPKVSADSAMAYWKLDPSLGKLADAGNFQKVREKINGGGIGADDADKRVQDYLGQIKSGSLKIDGSASSSGAGGTVTPTDTVASPKPTTPNTTSAENPNAGPIPSAYQQASTAKPTSPAQMVASPRPSFDTSGSGSAPAYSSSPMPSQDAYAQSKTAVNSGDHMAVMQQGLKENQGQTTLLQRIADGIDKLNDSFSKVASGASGAPAPAGPPQESNNYGKQATNMTKPSLSFRRSLAGV